MKIEPRSISVRDLVSGYVDSAEEGVIAYGGKLNVRPKYQREFVYKDKQRDAVVKTLRDGNPLNTMYWMARDGGFELLDGQQRTISVCQYVTNVFSVSDRFFHNLEDEEKEQILDYTLMVYFCEGTDRERLDWFRTINIAGEKLTDQELLNAVYTGTWLADAKKYFSKTGCQAFHLAKYFSGDECLLLTGSPIRQEYLETALSWISDGDVAYYMALHQHDPDGYALWQHFRNVVEWVRRTFPVYRKEQAHVNWGKLYNAYQKANLDPIGLEIRVHALMQDDDVTRKPGIYPFLLTGDERELSIRAFTDKMKREAYERCGGVCVRCDKKYSFGDMEADHITPWSEGGKTTTENCQVLCKKHNRMKSDS